MKLGIVVVYMVSERNEGLLDLHLSQIERNTTLPYMIYAAADKLAPHLHEKLLKNQRVRVCPCEAYIPGSGLLRQDRDTLATKGLTLLDSKYEHSWYLEQLIRQAVDDGVTHIALFHLDSFPVRYGWDRELIAKLSDHCVLAGVVRDAKTDYKPLTAGILFAREFYLRHRPRLLLTQEEMDSSEYQRYCQACPHCGDSGVGYGFRMFIAGLTWHPLFRSNLGDDHPLFGTVHGDMIFHLMATVLVDRQNQVGRTVSPSQRSGLIGTMAKVSTILVPEMIRRPIRTQVSERIKQWCRSSDQQDWERVRKLLLDDPENYLARQRAGNSPRVVRHSA